jgi:hypothetical protein
MALAKTLDKLGAVNIMLAGASETGVNTLVDDGINDTDVAQLVLDHETIKVFGKGWNFNTITKTLTPDSNGNIAVSTNYLRVDGEGDDYGRLFTVRSNLLYDITNDTNIFDKGVTVCVTQNIEFEDAPIHIRYYIAHRAARIYQMKANGDLEADAILAKEEADAWEEVKKNDSKTRDATWINRSRDPQRLIAQRRTPYS